MNDTELTPFVVTEALSKAYYKGLPSHPCLIATTKPGPFDPPTGPEAYSVIKEIRELGDHPLARVWDVLADRLRSGLNVMRVNWTSIDALRIVQVGESSSLAIVWIGVEPGALSFEEGSVVAHKCRTFIDGWDGIHDYHVEIREARVTRQAGNRFLDPVPLSDPTFTARDPYTATLGIPISTKNRPWAEETGGLYLSAGGNDKNIYLVTARHVVLPVDKDNNKEYVRKPRTREAPEDVIILGTAGFNEKLRNIDREIRIQEYEITDANERINLVNDAVDPASVTEREAAGQNLREAEKAVKELRALRNRIATDWKMKEKRVFGELAWAPPIVLSTEPGQYTLDLAVIKIDTGMLDSENYRGNTINIGNKYNRGEFMEKVYLHHASDTTFKYPATRLVTLQYQIPAIDLVKLPMLDADGAPCLVVFKNGAKTGTTIGRGNNVSSFTRTYFAGQFHESREWPVVSTDKDSGPFSVKGDSGSCVADAFSRVGGIITGGSGITDSSDVTYVTPISFIMDVLHKTEQFKHAHLNPVLA